MPPEWVGHCHCHCHQCQQIHGAAFVTWVGFKTDDFEINDPENFFTIYDSGKADRGFCSNCGSSFYFKNNKNSEENEWRGFVYFTRANIETDIHFEPQERIFYKSHAPWFSISDDLPRKHTT